MKLAVSALLIGSAAAFSSPSMTFSIGKKGKPAPKKPVLKKGAAKVKVCLDSKQPLRNTHMCHAKTALLPRLDAKVSEL